MQILASTLVSALGNGKEQHLNALKKQRTGLSDNTMFHQNIPDIDTFIGEVNGVENIQLPKNAEVYMCRNNQLAWQTLLADDFEGKVKTAVKTFGADRIGLVVGTSTSGIAETEAAFGGQTDTSEFKYESTHQMDSLARFCCQALGIDGPNFVISTACSSSAKVLAVAQRWLDADLVDAVVVGGVDSLCLTTLHGFKSLGLVSSTICKPLDEQRDGINIGEAGGFILLSKEKGVDLLSSTGIEIAGVGESSDAFHISTPHPKGRGASQAMKNALRQAGIAFSEIGYINLHGTSTPSNDLSELSGVSDHLVDDSPLWVSSTKGFTGHTLGAAGVTEVILCQWALENQMVYANLNLQTVDSEIEETLENYNVNIPNKTVQVLEEFKMPLNYVMSNSFGFGGNNASVILKRGL
ncbi:MAG: beta-ketoacyl-ACP synthase [Pseudomonadota bacterium]|nr:beta-ketoacyl-ACP synthase [Pseudomonadota bacterium]